MGLRENVRRSRSIPARVADPLATLTEPAERRSWLQRYWLWLLPVGCGGSLILLLAAAALLVAGVFAGIKSSWPYTEAVRMARENPSVVEALGEPIRPGWLVGGSMHMNRDSAEADLAIPIRGSENSGTIHVHARKRGDRWAFEVAVVEIRGRDEPIDLLEGLDMLRVERSGGPRDGTR